MNTTASTHREIPQPDSAKLWLKLWLTLGRVSNLPTVWSNVLAGVALASATVVGTPANPSFPLIVLAMLAMSMAYLAGMFLNDVFDAEFDKLHRHDRPIANGDIRARTVGLAATALILLCLGVTLSVATATGQSGWQALFATIALIGCIVLYNAWHKNNPLSPVIMGACRALVYLSAATMFTEQLSINLLIGAAVLWLYVIGLTYTAKQEHLNKIKNLWPLACLCLPLAWGAYISISQAWAFLPLAALIGSVVFALSRVMRRQPGDIPQAVITLIAGLSLLDSVLLFSAGFTAFGFLAMACWLLTLGLQRWVSGT